MCESYCCPYRKIVRCSLVSGEFVGGKKGFPLPLAYASYIIYYKVEEAVNRPTKNRLDGMTCFQQRAAKANATHCDARCSVLRWMMHRTASSVAAKHDDCFSLTQRQFCPISSDVLASWFRRDGVLCVAVQLAVSSL